MWLKPVSTSTGKKMSLHLRSREETKVIFLVAALCGITRVISTFKLRKGTIMYLFISGHGVICMF